MRLRSALLATLFGSLFCVAAQASTIHFTESSTVSGTLNGVAFNNLLLVISGSYDTANVSTSQFGAGTFDVNTALHFQLGNLSPLDSTSGTDYVFLNQAYQGVGVGTNGGDILDTTNPLYATLDLSTPFAPITGLYDYGSVVNTTGGRLILSSGSNVTFSTGGAALSATPEPASFALLSTGIAGIAAMRRKRS